MIEEVLGIAAGAAERLADAAARMLAPAATLLAFGYLAKRKAFIADLKRALGETALNLKLLAFNAVVTGPLLAIASLWAAQATAERGIALIDRDAFSAAPLAVVALAAIVLGDFIGYWRHRLEHTRLLWPAHAVHHSDTAMTFLAIERFHPINRFTTHAIDAGLLALIGFPPAAVLANTLVRHYYGCFIHADLPWTFGPFGRVFVSPAMHRWHHAADPAYFNANYATLFSVFDQAFGTFRLPGPCTAPLGVSGMRPTLASQLGYAFSPSAYRAPAETRSGTEQRAALDATATRD